MQIRELSKHAAVPAKTIRYYEEIGLLPPPPRQPNGYRRYSETDIERLKLVAGARRLDFSLEEIKELLDLRDRRVAPCQVLLDLLDKKAEEISTRIAELRQLERTLQELHTIGKTFPIDDVEGKHCVCHLVSTGLPGPVADDAGAQPRIGE
ncbi:MAG: heavy metal-responsive transcriptional regulator [Chloroflexi bacterium]|nr:heavy metal-responsive transcriptional regulator [Chloroflexota bacterium]